MCIELFQYDAKPQYIIALIAFSLQLDVRMQATWYQTDILIDLLHDNLQKINFDPCNLPWRDNTWKDYCYNAFLILVPTLFFCYYCSK